MSLRVLWEDLWFGHIPKQAFAELHSFTEKPILTLSNAKVTPSLISAFNLPLTVEAFKQFFSTRRAHPQLSTFKGQ